MKLTGRIGSKGGTPLDAEIERLQEFALAHPRDPQNTFVLARKLREAGRLEQALSAFELRASLAGLDQEVFAALLSAARVSAALGRSQGEVIDRFLRAFEFRPQRPETLGALAFYVREQGPRWQFGYLLASRAKEIPARDEELFAEPEWAKWRNLDEFAVAAYWVGDFEGSRDACETLLGSGRLPSAHVARVRENLRQAEIKA